MIKTTKIREFTDFETGQTRRVETKKFESEKVKGDKFYFVFFQYMQNKLKIKSAKTLLLLDEVCKSAEYGTGKVMLPVGEKKRICSVIGLDYRNISKHLRILESLNLIKKESEGVYLINPQIFWKGSMIDREKLLGKEFKFNVEFSIEEL